MAKVRAKTLTCTSCGAPLPVRNVFKAKTVVCRNCDTQLDLSSPALEILGKLPSRQKPQDAICLGLSGELPDGRSFEIIGRLRFSDFDDEESWFWDEWLLLAENGEYLWLQEDGKSFELQTPFMPNHPPTLDALRHDYEIPVDGTSYRVVERGRPSVSYVEGELTWRAKVGDTVDFVDARGPGGGFGAEFSEDEMEFFRRQHLSRKEAFQLCGLQLLLDLEDERDRKREAYQKGPKAMGCGGIILGAGAILAFVMFAMLAVVGATVSRGDTYTLTAAELTAGKELGFAELHAGSEYILDYDSTVHPPTTAAHLKLLDPTGKAHELLTVANLQKTGEADLFLEFKAERDGIHKLVIDGTVSPMVEITPTPAAPAIKSIKWSIKSQPINGGGLFCVAPMLLIGGFGFFIVSAGRRSAASARAAREFRKDRRELIDELHHQSRIQGG